MVAIGTPKTDKEIGAELKTLARLQLQTEDPHQGYSVGTRAPEVSWRKKEDLRIMGPGGQYPETDKETLKPGRIKPPANNWLDQEIIEKEVEFEKRYGISLTEAVTKLAISKGLDLGGPVKVPGFMN